MPLTGERGYIITGDSLPTEEICYVTFCPVQNNSKYMTKTCIKES
jgi:hypothetical protein